MAGFIGTHNCKVDSKGRINVPASFRRFLGAEGGETFVLTRGFDDDCLTLYAPAGWRDFQSKLSSLPTGKAKRTVIRYFSKNSVTLVLDKQGRISMPKGFLASCRIEGDLLLVGALENIEIWNPQDFDEQIETAADALGELEHLL
ncbi:MAG: division/cell wall cluster transcriptional repressor MraZ [bacterium]|nr:division/cell wall cluster transcriptional repressor MraZ [bacterium]